MGLFSRKTKKPQNLMRFVLLDNPRWDRYLFVADFQADWGIDLDRYVLLSSEEDVLRANINGVTLMVTFMDEPLPERKTTGPEHAAHLVVVVSGGTSGQAAFMDQVLESLMKQDGAIEIV